MRTPKLDDVGKFCRVKFHDSKLWEAGWVITSVSGAGVCAKQAGRNYSTRQFAFDMIEVVGNG